LPRRCARCGWRSSRPTFALPVIKSFIESVKAKAVGAEVSASLTPAKRSSASSTARWWSSWEGRRTGFSLRAQPPIVVLLAGLQGAGKTTTAAKLARWLIEREKKRVLLTSTDISRPAAILQLERLAGQVGAQFFAAPPAHSPAEIAQAALDEARRGVFDILIVDTAGRLHVDEALMAEVRQIDAAVSATERLFVVDAMAGQDAINAARAFGATLDLTGIVLTKADGTLAAVRRSRCARSPASPSFSSAVGEKTDALEPFDPERMASRILGMGDVVSLVEQVQREVTTDEATRLAQKVARGKGIDLADLKGQLEQVQKLGGMGSLLDKLPAAGRGRAVSADQGDREVRRQIAIINSMTPREPASSGGH